MNSITSFGRAAPRKLPTKEEYVESLGKSKHAVAVVATFHDLLMGAAVTTNDFNAPAHLCQVLQGAMENTLKVVQEELTTQYEARKLLNLPEGVDLATVPQIVGQFSKNGLVMRGVGNEGKKNYRVQNKQIEVKKD